MTDPRNIEDLSDDEIAGMSAEQFAALSGGEQAQSTTNEGSEDDAKEAADRATEEAARQAEEEAAAVAAKAAEAKKVDNEDEDTANVATNGAQAGKGDDGKAAEDAQKATDANKAAADADKVKVDGDKQKDAPVNADAQLAALFAPFKANGRDMSVTNVDEARQLMSMGANYSKKMAGMKPHLATLRMLETAKIGTEDLNFLIDLHRRDPAAINKLVQDSKIDPMDLSADKAAGYKAANHRPSDAEVELDAVLQEISDDPAFQKTAEVVSKMDRASQAMINQKPGLLKLFNAHMNSGHYDIVQAEIDRRRTFGQLSGLSDLEAYRQVGDELHASGKFAHLESKAGQPADQGQRATSAPAVIKPDPKKAEDGKRNDAKRAVAPVKAAPSGKKADPDFNPLSLSDEEFAKKFGKA